MSVSGYHDRTKHQFHRFAPSLGYLDWATQPNPFRRYSGAPTILLSHAPLGLDVPYDELYQPRAAGARAPAPLTPETLAEFLRCSLGLSAWKQHGAARWALRVNPSSGNLHPTEGYLVTARAVPAASSAGARPPLAVYHYAPEAHALEERCVLEGSPAFAGAAVTPSASDLWSEAFLVGLSSIHWREAWKYGERAFRYCQHDAGHAIAALRFSASLFGWEMALLPRWSDAQAAALLGLGAQGDDDGPEPEEPACLAVVTRRVADDSGAPVGRFIEADPQPLVDAARRATWRGMANRLSPARVPWPAIDEVARETAFHGTRETTHNASYVARGLQPPRHVPPGKGLLARAIILQRRSAVAFDGRSTLPRDRFFSMLRRLRPDAPPWDAIGWEPHVHLVLFVHRVDGVLPGIYAFARAADAAGALRAACRDEFLWEAVPDADGLFLLAPLDCRPIARRLSCDQDIAADGFFGMAMLARFEDALRSRGDWMYRNLFWECGMVGQVLYLEAEAAGARATGIGCYYDDPVHELLGLSGHAWQSLYHFSMGAPVDDMRLTTEPGYGWETEGASSSTRA